MEDKLIAELMRALVRAALAVGKPIVVITGAVMVTSSAGGGEMGGALVPGAGAGVVPGRRRCGLWL